MMLRYCKSIVPYGYKYIVPRNYKSIVPYKRKYIMLLYS